QFSAALLMLRCSEPFSPYGTLVEPPAGHFVGRLGGPSARALPRGPTPRTGHQTDCGEQLLPLIRLVRRIGPSVCAARVTCSRAASAYCRNGAAAIVSAPDAVTRNGRRIVWIRV